MEKGKEPVIYISDDEKTTDHSEEKVELNNGEMMNAPEEKANSDAVKLAESKEAKRRQQCRDADRRRREKRSKYITNLEKEEEKLKIENTKTTESIKLYENQHEDLLRENQSLKRELQSLNEGYIQSLEENRRLLQENLQQEQSRAPIAAQDPNSMLEPRQIQTSGPSHQHAHQLGGPHNAGYPSYGIMVPQQILTSGPSHQPVGPHNAAYHSSGIMVPQQIQTSGSSHRPDGPHYASRHSYGMLDTDADIMNGLQEPSMRELGQSSASQKGVYNNPSTWVVLLESDQDVPSPQLSADDSVLGSEMPSTAQLQGGMSSTDVEKAKSDAGQIE